MGVDNWINKVSQNEDSLISIIQCKYEWRSLFVHAIVANVVIVVIVVRPEIL